jgi:long-chain fatty acid transport protein
METSTRTTFARLSVMAALAVYAGRAGAAGFALMEQSASGLGNAYAGQAAVAQDATTVFINPAGMSFLPGPQVVVGVAAIDVSAKFSNNGSSIPNLATLTGSQPGDNGGNAGSLIGVPNFYATLPVGDRFSIGIGVTVPFGLKTEYDDTWIGRFQGIESKLTTINYNPAVAYKVTDTISIGAGVSYQFLQVDLTNAVATQVGEGRTRLTAQDGAWGWNLGAIFQVSPDMRIGASYRSRLDYNLKGSVNTTFLANGAAVPNGSFSTSADVTFPDMFSLSVAQKFGDKWDMLGDITYTHWGVLQQINIINAANGATRESVVLNFQDAWRLSLGLNYHLSESWTLKGGLAWDQSPVQDQFRTVRLPDNDRYWLAMGASYRPSKALTFDVGYAYSWFPTTSINNTQIQPGLPSALGTSTVDGEYKNFVNVLALQVSYTF